jgi:hypothetical protein
MRWVAGLAGALAVSGAIVGCDPSAASELRQIQGWLADGNMVFEVTNPTEHSLAVDAEQAMELAIADFETLDRFSDPGSDAPPPWRPLNETPVLGRFSCTAPNCSGYTPDGPRLAWMVWGGGTPPRSVVLIDAATGELFFRGAPEPGSI